MSSLITLESQGSPESQIMSDEQYGANFIHLFGCFLLFKTCSHLLQQENAPTLFCCEAPGTFSGLQISLHGSNKFNH